MNGIAKLVVRHSRLVLFGFIALMALSTIGGFQAFGKLQAAGYDNPGSQSGIVARVLQTQFHQSQPDIILVTTFQGQADDTASVAIGSKLQQSLATEAGVNRVTSYFSLQSPPALRSTDGKSVYFFVYFNKNADTNTTATAIQNKYDGHFHGARIYVAGWTAVAVTINHHISSDLALAESIAVPVTVLLLVFAFGSLVASGLPFLVAVISAFGAFLVIWLVSLFTDVSVFSINLVTGMSLGLGIDYALLIVNRFREERARGHEVADAVTQTLKTAGRTVFFSGFTVAVVMAALLFFPQYFLRSFAVAGMAAVGFAVVGALFPLCALLNLLGDRVNKGKVLQAAITPKETGFWEVLSRAVMRRPLPIVFVILLFLGGITSIAFKANFGLVDDRILPKQNSVVVANDVIRTSFSGREGSPIEVLLRNPSQNQLLHYTNQLSQLKHVVRVQSPLGITQNGFLDNGYAPIFSSYRSDGFVRVQAIGDVEPRSGQGVSLIKSVRAIQTPIHYVRVGGSAASFTDSIQGISDALPWSLGWMTLATLILLFLFTGSVLLPIKAVLLNALSLGTTLGFLTWVFQLDNLHWLVGAFQVTGSMDLSTTVLVVVIAFGLSMDYELFLLGRIKEEHDRGMSTIDSVSYGLQRSGRIVTTAAFVLAVSFFGFVTSGVSIMKLLGLGIAFAILLDATIVRALLVPALMRLFGAANWWAPKWLKWVYHKAGLDH
ncbi:MAG: hypothetical protein RL508_556 [Actinomycetota bacterium]|jgi:RND superfamily putative drug exporter